MRKTLGTTILVAGLALAGSAPAGADTLPTCPTITSINCGGTFENVRLGDGRFVQTVNGAVEQAAYFWPFRNPTVNAAAAVGDSEAFPADYATSKAGWASCVEDLGVSATVVDRLRRANHRQARKIRRLRAQLAANGS